MRRDLAVLFFVIHANYIHYQASFRELDVTMIIVPVALVTAFLSKAWFPSLSPLFVNGDVYHAVHFVEQATNSWEVSS